MLISWERDGIMQMFSTTCRNKRPQLSAQHLHVYVCVCPLHVLRKLVTKTRAHYQLCAVSHAMGVSSNDFNGAGLGYFRLVLYTFLVIILICKS